MPAPKKTKVVYAWRLTPLCERYACYFKLFNGNGELLHDCPTPFDDKQKAQAHVQKIWRAFIPQEQVNPEHKLPYVEVGPGKKPAMAIMALSRATV